MGTIAAQLVHAAGESSPGNLPDGTYALVLAAENESELAKLEFSLIEAGATYRAIREPDPPHNGALMAIGLAPLLKRSLPKFMKKLPLLR